jgi:hypothetical protein
VAEGHPAFGLNYDDANKLAPGDEDDYSWFRVHGGLTFSDFCQEGDDAEDRGICHVAQTGQPERVWWLGFDAAHCDDLSPAMFATASEQYRRAMMSNPRYAYRTLEYIQAECADLARQLRAVA